MQFLVYFYMQKNLKSLRLKLKKAHRIEHSKKLLYYGQLVTSIPKFREFGSSIYFFLQFLLSKQIFLITVLDNKFNF